MTLSATLRRAFIGGLAWLIALPAFAAVLPATPATLTAVLAAAQPGDTVAFSAEAFAPIWINKRVFKPPITLDLRDGATLERMAIASSTGVHVLGGSWTPADVKEQVSVTFSDDVTFDGAQLRGNLKATAFKIADSSNVKVLNSRMDSSFQAINSGRVKNAEYAGNTIVGQNNDGIVIYANNTVRIAENEITGSNRQDKRHPDGIQFIFRSAEQIFSTNVTVEDNVIVLPAQGIFGAGIKGGVIRNNFVKVDHSGGIYLSNFEALTVEKNIVGTLGDGADWAQIMLKGTAIRKGNWVKAHGRHAEIRD